MIREVGKLRKRGRDIGGGDTNQERERERKR